MSKKELEMLDTDSLVSEIVQSGSSLDSFVLVEA